MKFFLKRKVIPSSSSRLTVAPANNLSTSALVYNDFKKKIVIIIAGFTLEVKIVDTS